MSHRIASLVTIVAAVAVFAGASRPSCAANNVSANGYTTSTAGTVQVYVSANNYGTPRGSVYIGAGSSWLAGSVTSLTISGSTVTLTAFVTFSNYTSGTATIVLSNAGPTVSFSASNYLGTLSVSSGGTKSYGGYVCIW